MRAGTATPPTAASMGSAAWRGLRSWPIVISYLSSMPTSMKKMAMRKSLMNASSDMVNVSTPTPSVTGASRISSTTS